MVRRHCGVAPGVRGLFQTCVLNTWRQWFEGAAIMHVCTHAIPHLTYMYETRAYLELIAADGGQERVVGAERHRTDVGPGNGDRACMYVWNSCRSMKPGWEVLDRSKTNEQAHTINQ